ncbi:hypothetical protein [Ferviditalea candida]|uniref:DUF5668 domain-containing protein n=1 Tax=Ferviditalea candida TaxID=3108399 RepID=A0ABU5ZDT5_9BACL|nr:hypothetical protein [Paenibacillaceae bacterium T2]
MPRNSYASGMFLLIFGIFILLGKLGVIGFLISLLWPAVLLIPGLLLHWLYFARLLPSGMLIPAGMLTTYALMFFFANLFGWGMMKYIWPGFIFGAAVGFYEIYLFDRGSSRGFLMISVILAAVSAVFFGFTLLFGLGTYFIAFVLIISGAVMIYRRQRVW